MVLEYRLESPHHVRGQSSRGCCQSNRGVVTDLELFELAGDDFEIVTAMVERAAHDQNGVLDDEGPEVVDGLGKRDAFD